MNYNVLKKCGSDASYDLIIEAIEPKPSSGYVLNSVINTNNIQAEELIKQSLNLECLKNFDWGIRFNIFQHIPDKWVLVSRLESLLKKMENKNLT